MILDHRNFFFSAVLISGNFVLEMIVGVRIFRLIVLYEAQTLPEIFSALLQNLPLKHPRDLRIFAIFSQIRKNYPRLLCHLL